MNFLSGIIVPIFSLLSIVTYAAPFQGPSDPQTFEEAAVDNIQFIGIMIDEKGAPVGYISLIISTLHTANVVVDGTPRLVVQAFFLGVPPKGDKEYNPRLFPQAFDCMTNAEIIQNKQGKLVAVPIKKDSLSSMTYKHACKSIKII